VSVCFAPNQPLHLTRGASPFNRSSLPLSLRFYGLFMRSARLAQSLSKKIETAKQVGLTIP